MKKILFLMVAFASFAFAADDAKALSDVVASYAVLGVGFQVGLAALGGAIGMGNTAAAAISGTARNPGLGSKLSTTMFIALAMIEAQVIYALVIAFIILGKTNFIG